MRQRVGIPEITDAGFKYRGAVGAAASVACVLWTGLVLLQFDAPLTVPWHVVSVSIAWCLLIAGGGVRLWATIYVGGRKNHELVAEGPYSMCRNPLYLGTFLILASACFFLESLVAVACAAGIVAFYCLATIPSEERYLSGRWGKAFDDYRAHVPCVLPRISSLRTTSHVNVKIHCLWLEVRRMSAWIWLPIFSEFLHHVRTQ